MHGKPRDTVNRDTVNRETTVATANNLNKIWSTISFWMKCTTHVQTYNRCFPRNLSYDVISYSIVTHPCCHVFSGHVTSLNMWIFWISAYMNFHKNLIHIRRTHFRGEPDAEKIREIRLEMAKWKVDIWIFTIATLLYYIDVISCTVHLIIAKYCSRYWTMQLLTQYIQSSKHIAYVQGLRSPCLANTWTKTERTQ